MFRFPMPSMHTKKSIMELFRSLIGESEQMSLWSENEVRIPEPIKNAGHRDVKILTESQLESQPATTSTRC